MASTTTRPRPPSTPKSLGIGTSPSPQKGVALSGHQAASHLGGMASSGSQRGASPRVVLMSSQVLPKFQVLELVEWMMELHVLRI